ERWGVDQRGSREDARFAWARRRAPATPEPIVPLEWILATQPRQIGLEIASWLERRLGETPDACLADSELLRWEDLRALRGGDIEVGAHTIDHACLPNEAPAEVERQLVVAKAGVEERVG